jgi:hypothetical protein
VVIGGWALLHISASVRVGRLEIDGGVRNALDRHYPDLIAGHIVSPGQPRALEVSVHDRW